MEEYSDSPRRNQRNRRRRADDDDNEDEVFAQSRAPLPDPFADQLLRGSRLDDPHKQRPYDRRQRDDREPPPGRRPQNEFEESNGRRQKYDREPPSGRRPQRDEQSERNQREDLDRSYDRLRQDDLERPSGQRFRDDLENILAKGPRDNLERPRVHIKLPPDPAPRNKSDYSVAERGDKKPAAAERQRRYDDDNDDDYDPRTPPVAEGGHRLYRKRDEQSDDPSVDLEMVEMRHPKAKPAEATKDSQGQKGGQRQRVYQKYQKGPSADSVPRRFSSHQGVRGSAYSELSVKSWSEVRTEISVVKDDLYKHFKPIFDNHGPEGVLIKKLEEELTSRQSQHLLGRESILDALRAADRDGDDYLSYQDFVEMITRDLQEEKKLAFRGMVLSAITSVGILPIEKRDNFLATYTLCPPPLFIPIITLAQIIFFAAYAADMEKRGLGSVTANSGYPYYCPLYYIPTKRWQAWRFLTYMFVHDGYLHIIFNVIAQLLFGIPLELVHGWWRTMIIYLTGVTAGSLAHSVVDSNIGLVGASGGVYAILGAHLAAVVTNWAEMNYKLCDQEEFDSSPCCAASRLLASAPARLVVVIVLVIPDTALAIVRRAAFDEKLQVGVTAHVGGFLTGLFLGIRVLKNINEHAWEGYLGWVTVMVFLSVCAFSIFFNTLYTSRYPDSDWSWA